MSELTYANLAEPIAERAQRAPERRILTLIGEDGTHEHLTAADIDAEARVRAGGLRQAGIGRGDVVVLAVGALRPLIGAFLGCLYRGAVPTVSSLATDRLEPAVYRERLAGLVRGCAARAVISTDETPETVRMLEEQDCRAIAPQELGGSGTDDSGLRASREDVAFLQYSSGTAGVLKAIPDTHGALLRYLPVKRDWFLRPHDELVSWMPLYHDFGLISGLLYPNVFGAHAVLLSPFHWVKDPGILFRAVAQYGATIIFMANFALNHCVRGVRESDLAGIDLSGLDEVAIGGEPVRVESLRMFVDRFAPYGLRGSTLRTGYGMAETVEGVTAVIPVDFPPVDWIDRARLQEESLAEPVPAEAPASVSFVSCGAPMSGAEVRVVDERGQVVPERRAGEIEVRTPYMFGGYYRSPELTARVMRDDWFRTGDLGYLAGGELYVTGRLRDLIIVGGRKIHPEDLEHTADKIPGLSPGRSVAFGIDDPLLGSERIVMVCELRREGDAEQKRALERELRRAIARENGVTLGDVRLVARGWTVKTSSGKTARPINREKFLQELAGASESS